MSNDSPDLIFEETTSKPDRCPHCGETEIIKSDDVWRCPGCDAALAKAPIIPPPEMTSNSEPSGESVQDSSPDLDLPTAAEFVDTGKDSNLPAVDPKNWILGEWKDGDELVRRKDAEEAIRDREEQVRQRILDTLRMMRDNFQHRVDVALEEKEDAEEDSWNEKRSIERINCYDLAQRKIQELCEDLESSNRSADSSGDLQNGEDQDEEVDA